MARPIVPAPISPISWNKPEKERKKPGVIAGQNISGAPTTPQPRQTAAKTVAVVKTTTTTPAAAATPPAPPLSTPKQKKTPPPLPAWYKTSTATPPSPPAQKKATPPSPPAQRRPSFSATPAPQTPVAKKTDAKATELLRPHRLPPPTPSQVAVQTSAPPSTPPKKPLLPLPQAPLPPATRTATPPTPPRTAAQRPAQSPADFQKAFKENDFKEACHILVKLPPNARKELYKDIGERKLVAFFTELLHGDFPCVPILALAYEALSESTFRDTLVNKKTHNDVYDDTTLQPIIDLLNTGKSEDKEEAFRLLYNLADQPAPLMGALQFIAKAEKGDSVRRSILEYVQKYSGTKSGYAEFAAKLAKKLRA